MSLNFWNKRDLSILFANFFDHFDTTLYSLCAPLFASLFFPNQSRETGLLILFAVFLSATCMRPLGTLTFGFLSRRFGLEKALYWTLIGLGVATFCTGLLPTGGRWCGELLFFCRGSAAFFAAGEVALAPLTLLWGKEEARAYRLSYWYKTSTMLGIFAASVVFGQLTGQLVHLWRFGFIIGGGILILIAYSVRQVSQISIPSVEKFSFQQIWEKRRKILFAALLSGTSYLTYALVFLFLPAWAPLGFGVSQEFMWRWHPFLMGLDFCLILLLGWGVEWIVVTFQIKPLIGYSRILLFSAFGMVCMALGFGTTLFQGEWGLLILQIGIVVFGVLFCLPLTLYKMRLIGMEPNTPLLLGIAGSLGTTLIGRSLPTIGMALWLWRAHPIWIGGYVAFWFLLTFYVLLKEPLTEVEGTSLGAHKEVFPV